MGREEHRRSAASPSRKKPRAQLPALVSPCWEPVCLVVEAVVTSTGYHPPVKLCPAAGALTLFLDVVKQVSSFPVVGPRYAA